MKYNRTSSKLLIDAALFTGFIILFYLDLTGVELHQWLGIAGGALALYHLITHWEWVRTVTQRFFGHTSWQARLYYLVDGGLMLGFVLILFSGLAISTWFNLSIPAAWQDLHLTASIATLLLIVLKVAAHWRWISKAVQRTFSPGAAVPAGKLALQPVPVRPAPQVVDNSRRDFLKLMGVVGAASALALLQVSLPAEATETTSTVTTSTQTLENLTVQVSSNASVCSSSCRKGRSCRYPGECHDYVDRDGNGLCDRGECSS